MRRGRFAWKNNLPPMGPMTKDNSIHIHPKRILVCQLRQIGDVLLSTPSLRLLKEKYPEAEIDMLTEKKCAPVLENNPHLSRVWPIDKKALKNPFTALSYYAEIGRVEYDLIVDFQQLPRCKWVLLFSHASVRLTYTPPWYNKFLYTHWSDMTPGYAALAKASVLSPLGIKWDGQRPEIFLTDEERVQARALLEREGLSGVPFITVGPSHRRETRRWPAGHYAGLFKLLEDRYPALKVLILYGPGEKDLAEQILSESGGNVLLPEAMLTLRQMAAVMEKAVLHLGNCSSPRHFAVAVNTPSVTIQGATSTAWRFPSSDHLSLIRQEGCHMCNRNTCKLGTFECLREYAPERVLSEFSDFLDTCLERRGGDQ
ncbi:glycosyltransferase family 9 protein [Desulfovibrio sp. Huiquan2017]|uniref:glycosyltransferase family 9 protein n=1 Tax=Desulfovibrio sp. Huiquan2017 TaxID=2816861 RepID=UPI0025703DB4|nr:glycosyltransferase family 9 protein [Desulfovibrio sp. Huiquan2017]